MSGVAVQLELDRPALSDDHAIFGPNSILGTFAEQSHTTFSASPGRISTFLSPAEPYMDEGRGRSGAQSSGTSCGRESTSPAT